MSSNYYWTPSQTTLLQNAYRAGSGLKLAQQLIPEKSRTTIAAKASRLGITTPKPRKVK